jgi:hypothetical protein
MTSDVRENHFVRQSKCCRDANLCPEEGLGGEDEYQPMRQQLPVCMFSLLPAITMDGSISTSAVRADTSVNDLREAGDQRPCAVSPFTG